MLLATTFTRDVTLHVVFAVRRERSTNITRAPPYCSVRGRRRYCAQDAGTKRTWSPRFNASVPPLLNPCHSGIPLLELKYAPRGDFSRSRLYRRRRRCLALARYKRVFRLVSARVAACAQECARIASFVHRAARSRVNNAAGECVRDTCARRDARGRKEKRERERDVRPFPKRSSLPPPKSPSRRDSREIPSPPFAPPPLLLDFSKALDTVIDTIGGRMKEELVAISSYMAM